MSYNADKNFPQVDRVFAPPLYTEPTLAVIDENLGGNPNTVANAITSEQVGVERWQFKDALNARAQVVETAEEQFDTAFRGEVRQVRNALQRFYDLEDMQKQGQRDWAGKAAVKEKIAQWVERQRRFREAKAQHPEGKGNHPELYTHDRRGQHFAGPGSDVERPHRYDLELFQLGNYNPVDFTEDIGREKPEPVKEEIDFQALEGFRDGGDFLGCPICTYQKEYNSDSNNDRNRAATSVKTHMRMTRSDPDDHKEALLHIKGQT